MELVIQVIAHLIWAIFVLRIIDLKKLIVRDYFATKRRINQLI